jgi:hypothetical protein
MKTKLEKSNTAKLKKSSTVKKSNTTKKSLSATRRVPKNEADATFGISSDRKKSTLERMTKEYKASKDKNKSQTSLGKPYNRSVYTKFDNKEFITPWSTERPSSETYRVPRGSTNTAKAERGKTASRQSNVNKRAINKANKPKKLY